MEVVFVDEGYTWEKTVQAADGEGIHLEVIKLPGVKKSFILLSPPLGGKALADIVASSTPKHRLYTRYFKQKLFGTDNACKIYGQKISEPDDAAVDHVEQYWLGGKTIPSNARLTHRYCNWARSKKDIAS